MAQVFQCHYMKAALFELNGSVHSSEQCFKYNRFVEQFRHISIDRKNFYTYLKRFVDYSRKKKLKTVEKEGFKKVFSREKWDEMDYENMKLHTLYKCNPCHHFPLSLNVQSSQLPTPFSTSKDEHLRQNISTESSNAPHFSSPLSIVSSTTTFLTTPTNIQHLEPDPFSPLPTTPTASISLTPRQQSSSSSTAHQTPQTPSVPLSFLTICVPVPENAVKGTDKIIAKEVGMQANNFFTSKFGNLFTDVASKVKEFNLIKRPTSAQRKQKTRKVQRKLKTSLECHIHQRDTDVHFGTRQSKRQYVDQRLGTYFETKEKAAERTKKRKFKLN